MVCKNVCNVCMLNSLRYSFLCLDDHPTVLHITVPAAAAAGCLLLALIILLIIATTRHSHLKGNVNT